MLNKVAKVAIYTIEIMCIKNHSYAQRLLKLLIFS